MTNPYDWPYDWLLRSILSAFTLLTVGMLLRPLWQLAKTRRALVIVFSRAVANFIRLCFDYPTIVVVYILKINISKLMPASYFYVTNGLVRTTECALHMHNLALAANRAHAICFPFHYNAFYAKKGKIYMICLLLWLLALCIGFLDPLSRTSINFSPVDTASKACMVTASICYVVLCCGMKKFNNSSSNSPSSEKDPIRILVVCMACLLMSTLRTVVLNQLATYSQQWPDVPRTIFYWSSYCAYLLALCTEEILLALLVPEFRANVRQQFRTVFCCFCGKKSNVGSIRNEVKINSLTSGI